MTKVTHAETQDVAEDSIGAEQEEDLSSPEGADEGDLPVKADTTSVILEKVDRSCIGQDERHRVGLETIPQLRSETEVYDGKAT